LSPPLPITCALNSSLLDKIHAFVLPAMLMPSMKMPEIV